MATTYGRSYEGMKKIKEDVSRVTSYFRYANAQKQQFYDVLRANWVGEDRTTFEKSFEKEYNDFVTKTNAIAVTISNALDEEMREFIKFQNSNKF